MGRSDNDALGSMLDLKVPLLFFPMVQLLVTPDQVNALNLQSFLIICTFSI